MSLSPAEPLVRLIRGTSAILREQPRLAELARATGQTGEMDSLAYFLSTPDAVRKTPWLMLLAGRQNPGATPSRNSRNAVPDDLAAAVLLFEYKAPLGRTGVFLTGDSSGRRNILAPPELRARTAAFAARTLIARGASIVHLAFCETHVDHEGQRSSRHGDPNACDGPSQGVAEAAIHSEFRTGDWKQRAAEWALQEKDNLAYLPLLPSFDQTLARIGRRTRINLRYYRRRAEADLGATFVPHASPTLDEFLQCNRECMYPVPEPLAVFRYNAAFAHPHQCMRGVRDARGRWLSLIGTRRQNNFVELDWQMNRSRHPTSSLGIVMRSYLIEHEIALGSTRLYMEGGTPNPIGRYFLNLRVAELTVKRKSAYVSMVKRLSPLVVPAKNYIAQTLARTDLHWRTV